MQEDGLEFSDVYNEFQEKIRRYLERMVGRNDAEDLTQEVFLKVSNGLGDFEGRSRLSTWIYRIATNAALDRLRSRSSREDSRKVELDTTDDGLEAEKIRMEETTLSAEREAIRSEMNDCIREFVDRLPQDYRTVIILSEMKDLKNQQIADILDISLDAVKIRLHRARARLKAEFEAGCDFYHDEAGGLACDRKSQESDEGP
jgi:RNA polymerase sigma-70 factor (ECF subfamily)